MLGEGSGAETGRFGQEIGGLRIEGGGKTIPRQYTETWRQDAAEASYETSEEWIRF